MSSGSNNVYVYGSTGVAVGSSNAVQVGRDNLNLNVGWDPATLLHALHQFREALSGESIPQEAKEELDDAALALEREAQTENPDHGRLRRLAKALATRVEAFGIGVGSGLFANSLPAIMAALSTVL